MLQSFSVHISEVGRVFFGLCDDTIGKSWPDVLIILKDLWRRDRPAEPNGLNLFERKITIEEWFVLRMLPFIGREIATPRTTLHRPPARRDSTPGRQWPIAAHNASPVDCQPRAIISAAAF